MPCSNAAKTRNPLKFAGVPQTPEPISAASGPKFAILLGHVQEVLLLRRGKKEERKKPQNKNITSACAMQGGNNEAGNQAMTPTSE